MELGVEQSIAFAKYTVFKEIEKANISKQEQGIGQTDL